MTRVGKCPEETGENQKNEAEHGVVEKGPHLERF